MKKHLFKKSVSVIIAAVIMLCSWVLIPGEYNKASCTDACPHSETEFIEGVVILEATCSVDAILADADLCKACGEVVKVIKYYTGKKDPLNHNGGLVKVPAKAADCEEIGWNAYEYCIYCERTTYEEIPAIGHEYESETTEATCSAAGKTVYTCKNNPDHTYTVDIPVKPHLDADPEDGLCDTCGMNLCLHEKTELLKAQPSTCLSEGYTGGNYCTVCGLLVKAGKILPILDHSFSEVPLESKKATCWSDRVEVFKCKNCPETMNYIYRGSHKNVPHTLAYNTTVDSTCDRNGYIVRYCTTCSTNVEVEIIPPKGHVDENLDGKCDIFGCGGKVALPDGMIPPCDCMCHSESSIEQFFFKVINFFCKLIGINKECDCGEVIHY